MHRNHYLGGEFYLLSFGMSQDEILKSIQQGNYKHYLLFLKLYFKEIYQFLYYLNLGDKEKTKQETNQTFIRGLSFLLDKNFDDSFLGSMELQLYHLAYQEIAQNTISMDLIFLSKQEQQKFFWQQLTLLSLRERAIFLLKIFKNKSYQEISSIVSLSEQEIKSFFFEILAKLSIH